MQITAMKNLQALHRACVFQTIEFVGSLCPDTSEYMLCVWIKDGCFPINNLKKSAWE